MEMKTEKKDKKDVPPVKVGDIFKQGEKVRASGIYEVLHHGHKLPDHEVTCVLGKRFPPCRTCKDKVEYKAVHLAFHAENDRHLKKPEK